MKSMNIIKKLLVSLLLLTDIHQVNAQINIQVRVLPPYQSRISEYASRPDLMLLTLSNTGLQPQEIQLSGSVRGDNGIAAWVKPGFRSPQPIRLEPGEIVNLNGHDFAFLFDANHLQYTGISRSDVVRGVGLLEGTYELCIRALDYESHQPLSPDNPLGCTVFTISNVEPPVILMPFHEQVIQHTAGPQVLPISWSTPPGSSPLTEYRVKMVEIFAGLDPNDALQSEYQPGFFEETVMTNSLLYGPAHPQLTPGRKYALMVQAVDPFQTISFRNHGQSQVIQFTYGEELPASTTTAERSDSGSKHSLYEHSRTHATNEVSGRLLWAFKFGEESYSTSAAPINPYIPRANSASFLSVADSGFYHNSPLQMANYTALVQQDPSLPSQSGGQSDPEGPTMQTNAFVSSNTASALNHHLVSASTYAGTERHPLVGATVLIRGEKMVVENTDERNPRIPVKGGKARRTIDRRTESTLLASGRTDEAGYYTLSFLHPEYEGGMAYDKLVLSVHTDGFEPYEQDISFADLAQLERLDLGEKVLLARTFRLNLQLTGEHNSISALQDSDVKVTLLRAADDVAHSPHLLLEGADAAETGTRVTIGNSEYVTVASKVIATGSSAQADYIDFGVSGLFYEGRLFASIESSSSIFEDEIHSLRVTDPGISADQTLLVHAEYEWSLTDQKVEGEVWLTADNQQLPVEGALLQIEFDAADVVFDPIFTSSINHRDLDIGISGGLSGSHVNGGLPIVNIGGGSTDPTVMTGNGGFPGFNPAPGTGSVATGGIGGIEDVSGGMYIFQPTADNQQNEAPSQASTHTAVTDSSGYYFFGSLPTLRPGAEYTVKLVQLPHPHQHSPVTPELKSYTFQAEKGKIINHTWLVQTQTREVTGRIVDEDGQAVPLAQLRFKNSNNIFETDERGHFVTTHLVGDHSITVEKLGFRRLEAPVTIAIPTRQAVDAMDLGDLGPLIKRTGRIRFEVVDKDTKIPLPDVTIQLFDTTQVTDDRGIWEYKGQGGRTLVRFTPAQGMPYYASERSMEINDDGDLHTVQILMERGIRVYGRIHSDDQSVADANIRLEDTDLHHVLSDEQGLYEIYLPPGEQNIRAAKSGHISKVENRQLPDQGELELHFELQSGQGRNISRLLGFEIELDKAADDGPAGQKWSGKFVNLKPASELLSGDKRYELSFSDVKVTFDADGNAIPENNEVTTENKSVSMEIFKYLPVQMNDIGGKKNPIKVRMNQLGLGTIRGQLNLDYAKLVNNKRLKFKEGDELFIGLQDHVAMGNQGLEIFRPEDASIGSELALRLLTAQGDSTEVDLFGFKVMIDLAATALTPSGLHMKADLTTPKLGPVQAARFHIKSLKLNTSLDVEEILIDTVDLPVIGINSFNAEISRVSFNENGFKMDGKLRLQPLSSVVSEINFSDLRLSKELLFGGLLVLPTQGIDIHRLASFTTGEIPLSFGRVGNSDVYMVSGSGEIQFKKLFTKKIKLNSFMLKSDGKFNFNIPANIDASLAFAKMTLRDVIVDYSGTSPFIALDGSLKLDVPMVTLEASKINLRVNSSGAVTFDTDTISGQVNAPIVKIGLKVALLENGLGGGGSLSIPGTPINAEVGFHYNRVDNGIDVGANFSVGSQIVIGAAEITELGGGFTYNSGDGKFMGTINGNVSVVGMSSAVSLKPVKLTVTDGPVIQGETEVQVADKVKLAKAHMIMDFRDKFFTVEINQTMEPLEGVASATANGLLYIKWAPEDTYVFLGVNMEVNLLNFAKSSGTYLLGVNIKNPKNHHNASIKNYFATLDDTIYGTNANSSFSGIYVHLTKNVGVPKKQAKGINLYIVSGKAWFHSYADAMLILNFAQNDYRFGLAGSLSAGAEGCIKVLGCLGASFDACFAFAGGYTLTRGWFLSGNAAGNFTANLGCNARCNSIRWCGAKICVGAQASFLINTRGSSNYNIGLGSSSSGNLCN